MAKSKRKMTALEKKVQILEQLKSIGICSEKQLQNINLEQLLKIEGITIEDLRGILEVQRLVKTHALFSWLCSEEDENATSQEPESPMSSAPSDIGGDVAEETEEALDPLEEED